MNRIQRVDWFHSSGVCYFWAYGLKGSREEFHYGEEIHLPSLSIYQGNERLFGMRVFLESSEWIDSNASSVSAKASELAVDCAGENQIVERCFHFVRDEIRHSWDHQCNPVTCRASDVLEHGTGYCFAKSHLLAALLRANGLPTALCYQRLHFDESGDRFCLHGLNAVYLSQLGWYRIDPRGNKEGVSASFSPPRESLAFVPAADGERDYAELHSHPRPEVVSLLTECETYQDVADRLPDA